MTVQDILNQIDIQNEYVLVYYDSEDNQRYKLDKCPFTMSIKVDYMYIVDNTIFFELNEDHLLADKRIINRKITFLNPTQI